VDGGVYRVSDGVVGYGFGWESCLRLCPAERARCARGDHFVMGIPLRLVLPMVASENLCADHREAQGEAGMLPTKWARPT
jgi:hypothetical protein